MCFRDFLPGVRIMFTSSSRWPARMRRSVIRDPGEGELLQRRVFSVRGLRVVRAAPCLAVLVFAAGRPISADAGVSGQNDAWTVHFGTDPGELFNPQDLGVDPVDGSTYILSNDPAGTSVRIDKFSATGELKGSVSVPRPEAGPEDLPVGFVGIAVD